MFFANKSNVLDPPTLISLISMRNVFQTEPLAKRVVRLRKKLGLSQLELAAKVGVSDTTIQKIELGAQKDLRLNNAIALAEALGVTLEYLAYGERKQSLQQAEVGALLSSLGSASVKTLLATARALLETQVSPKQNKTGS